MNVTFKPIVVQGGKRKDGTYIVYIRVTFAGKCRRIPTTLVATPADLTRNGRIKNSDILEKAGRFVSRMRAALADVTVFDLDGWDVERVVGKIRDSMAGELFRLDFFQWADGWLDCKSASTRRTYDQALGALERFLGERKLDVNEITKSMLIKFVDYVNDEPKVHRTRKRKWEMSDKEKQPGAAAARHVKKLAHIFRAAKDRYNDEDSGRIVIPRSPFDSIHLHIPPTTGKHHSIGIEAMQRLILLETGNEMERIALDAFIVSFALMGANLADLYAAEAFDGTVWEYNRQKTRKRRADGALMRVTVQDTTAPFIARLRANGECLGRFWLGALHRVGSTAGICTSKINAKLREIQAREGIADFTFGDARHTWATIARSKEAGIEKATVDECLAHVGDYDLTDIYAERSWDRINEANAKVLALFRWPE